MNFAHTHMSHMSQLEAGRRDNPTVSTVACIRLMICAKSVFMLALACQKLCTTLARHAASRMLNLPFAMTGECEKLMARVSSLPLSALGQNLGHGKLYDGTSAFSWTFWRADKCKINSRCACNFLASETACRAISKTPLDVGAN